MQQRFLTKLTLVTALCAITATSTWAADFTPQQTATTPAVMTASELRQKLIWLAGGNKWADYNQCYNDCMYYAGGRGQYATTFSDQFRCRANCKHLRPKN
ncbi:MAG: hypothetical protein WA790_06500 [Sulfitobacter sp.]